MDFKSKISQKHIFLARKLTWLFRSQTSNRCAIQLPWFGSSLPACRHSTLYHSWNLWRMFFHPIFWGLGCLMVLVAWLEKWWQVFFTKCFWSFGIRESVKNTFPKCRFAEAFSMMTCTSSFVRTVWCMHIISTHTIRRLQKRFLGSKKDSLCHHNSTLKLFCLGMDLRTFHPTLFYSTLLTAS